MKFVKQSQINFRNVKDTNLAVIVDGDNLDASVARDERVVMEVTNSLLIPKGSYGQRPGASTVEVGMIRYNTDWQNDASGVEEFEFYTTSGWRRVRFDEPGPITMQPPAGGAGWLGDANEQYFGPLDSGDFSHPVPDLTTPQNIMVYVENVYQIPATNYTLVDLDGINNPAEGAPSAAFYASAAIYPAGRYVRFDTPVPFSKPVTILHGFDR